LAAFIGVELLPKTEHVAAEYEGFLVYDKSSREDLLGL
jgi:hypothetical protein